MELHLQSLSAVCFVTGATFAEGDRILSSLVQMPDDSIIRIDLLESSEEELEWPGESLCRWTVVYQPDPPVENIERDVRLTAENFFLELTSVGDALPVENNALVQFLALMLERKRVLKARGLSEDGRWKLFEYMKAKSEHRVPVGEISSESLLAIRDQLEVVLGVARPAAEEPSEDLTAPSGS